MIFFISDNYGNGGVTKFMDTWCDEFTKLGINSRIIIAQRTTPSGNCQKKNNVVFWGRLYERLCLLNTVFRMLVLFRENKSATIILNKSWLLFPCFIAKSLSPFCRIRCVYFIHGGASELLFRYSNLKKILMWLVCDFVGCVVNDLQNQNVIALRPVHTNLYHEICRKVLNSFLPDVISLLKNKILVVPNGVDVRIRKRNTKRNSNSVICVGRFDFIKGQDLLLRSWQIIEARHPKWNLLFLGDGPLLNEAIFFAHSNHIPRVQFLGFQHNVNTFLADCKIFACPSREEGMSIAVLEAMAASLPIVCFETVSAGALIKHDVNGLVVSPGSVEEFAEALHTLMSDDVMRCDFGLSSYNISKNFLPSKLVQSWAPVLSRYKNSYE